MWNNQEYYFSIIAQTQVYSKFQLHFQSLRYETLLCVATASLSLYLLLHSCSAPPPSPLLIFCSLSTSPNTFPLYPLFPSSGSFNLPFPQPTTAASQSCRPSLMSGPLNCRPWATRSSIRVRPASIWPEDQSTGPAGPTGAGRGSLLCAQVTTFLPSDHGRSSSRLIRRR